MAPRPYWRGYLKLSLVTCAVALTPATTESEKLKFHTINRQTGDRIFSRYVDAETGKEVEPDDQVKGYEKAENDYVVLEDEELEAVRLESARTIDIDAFVPHDSVEWVYYDTPYFMTPNDEVGEEAYSVIRQAMVATKTSGIARLVLNGRERAVMLEPRDKGIVLWTLRFGTEVRDENEYWKGLDEHPDPKMMPLIERLIEERTKPWSPNMVRDPVQAKLLDLIKAREAKGKKSPRATKRAAKAAPETGNVIDLMAALKKSIEQKPAGRRSAR
jgi:DNA end-binding protein Ku